MENVSDLYPKFHKRPQHFLNLGTMLNVAKWECGHLAFHFDGDLYRRFHDQWRECCQDHAHSDLCSA